MTTTNGTRCLQRIENAKVVIAAALINRRSIVEYLKANKPESIWILGSGWVGSYFLEDTVCAGAIAQSLLTETKSLPNEVVGNDEVFGAISLYLQWEQKLYELMNYASHGQRLQRLECYEDLKYCSQSDILDILPIQKEAGVLTALAGTPQ